MPHQIKVPPGFTRHEHNINGLRTVVHIGGQGPTVVYWHGAGSWHGFDFAQSWLDRFQVIVPSHPGWGESADAPAEMDSVSDYLLHYLDLFEILGLKQFDLVGFSLGGWMASEFAVAHGHRLRKLVLVAPAGLPDPAHPGPTSLGTTLEEMYGYIANDVSVLQRHLPKTPEESAAHAAEVAREMQSARRLFAGGPFNPKLERWLHRVTMPTLLVWSKADRLVPAGRSEKWLKYLPNAKLKLVDRGGHMVLDENEEAREAVAKFLSSVA
jgi:pimeloyl-ACP methyl ester carboxylesterase